MSEPIIVTRDQAILGFLRISEPEAASKAERLVDDLIKLGVTGIARAASPSTAKESKESPRLDVNHE